MNNKSTRAAKENSGAFRRASVALSAAILYAVAAVVLLCVCIPSLVTLITGVSTVDDISGEYEGQYITFELAMLADYYAENSDEHDEATVCYAVTMVNDRLVTVILPKGLIDDADAFLEKCVQYLLKYTYDPVDTMTVSGTVVRLSDDELAMMYDWFGQSRSYLAQLGIPEGSVDYADVLSVYALKCGYAGSLRTGWAVALAILALALAALCCALLLRFRRICRGSASNAAKKPAKGNKR